MRIFWAMSAAGAALLASASAETRPAEVLQRFVYELVAFHKIQQDNLKDASSGGDQFAACINRGTAYRLEAEDAAAVLGPMKLSGEYAQLTEALTLQFQAEAKLYGEMSDICSQIVGGEKPGVDYQAIAAQMPALRAEIAHNEKSMYEISLLVAASVMGTPDGKVMPLPLTKVEWKNIVEKIEYSFADDIKSDAQHGTHTYLVSAALMIHDVLTKDFLKASDE